MSAATGYTQILYYGAEILFETGVYTSWQDEREEDAVILQLLILTANAIGTLCSIFFLLDVKPKMQLMMFIPVLFVALMFVSYGMDRA